jgi:hypothetical protein
VDQSKSIFTPRTRPPISQMSRRHRLEVRVGGGINFSIGANYIFFSLAAWPAAGDLVMTQTFEMIHASVTSESPASRARTLRIHVDGTSKENKHQWLWAFCGWLLQLGWYDVIAVTFLPVGHTENKVDSLVFSRMHKHATFQGVQSLFDVVTKAATHLPKPHHIVIIDSLYAFREFFKDFLPGVAGHRQGLHFQIFLSEGIPVMRAKQFVTDSDDAWGEPIPVLTGTPDYSTLKRYEESLDPVFPQVAEGLKACLRLRSLSDEGEQFVQQVLQTRSLTKSTPEAPNPCVVVVPDSRADGKIGLEGTLGQGVATVPVRVICGSAPPAIPISHAAQRFRDAEEPLDVLLRARLAAAQGPVTLKRSPAAARSLSKQSFVGGMEGGGRRGARARGWKEVEIGQAAGPAVRVANEDQPDESDESDESHEPDAEGEEIEYTIVEEYWSPPPKGGKWSKQTYSQRMYRLRMTDDEGGTDFRALVAEDLAPTKFTPLVLADQNAFYEEAIAGWREGHPSPPTRPTRHQRRSKRTKLNK